jgi:capsular polysaccharide biosynthesis protein/Mrp family chromosome partitioning ATPase
VELLKRGWTIVRWRWPILLAFLAIAAVGIAVYHGTAGTKYTASTELFLRAPDVKTSSSAYQGDLFSRQRAQTYVKMFHSDELAQMVIDRLGLTETPQQLVSKVSATTVKDTVLMVVSVTDSNPQRAANIANGYGDVLGTYVAKLENVGNDPHVPPLVQVVTKANPNSARLSGYPLSMVAFTAVFVALLAASGLIWFLEHFETKVGSRRQVEEITGSDIIGKLPKTRALGANGNVAQAFDASEKFSQEALRLSLNVESVLRRLPKVEIPPVIAVVAGHREDEGTVATRALARAFADRGRTVGVVRLAARQQQSEGTDLVVAGSASAEAGNRTDPVTTVSCSTPGLTAEILDREVDALRPGSDVILIDVAAFHESIDAQLAVGASEAVLLVVRPIATTTHSLSELVAGIKVLDTPVLGVVVNLANESSTVDGFYL